MKEISLTIKHKVVKLFLSGLSYDEIARQLGIAKGSVVNIINEFREGRLQLPPDMTEFADALRQVAVDLRRNNISIAQVRSCLKLHAKLGEMGVSSAEAEHWLDICHDIASPSVSTEQFVAAALELARAASERGLSYRDVLDDYHAKLSKSRDLDKAIKRQKKQVREVRARHQHEKRQATRELEAITKAIDTAHDTFRKQKEDLNTRLEQCLAEHNLCLENVKTAVALLDAELSKATMAKADIKGLSKRIHDAGSLAKVITELEHKKEELKSEVDRTAKEKEITAAGIEQLRSIDDGLQRSIAQNKLQLDELNTELYSKTVELHKFQETASRLRDNLYLTHLIVGFLFAPDCISDYDLDRLVSLMIGLRQKRLGIGSKQVKDRDGEVICECQVPRTYVRMQMGNSDMDQARENFAYLLVPLVKDKFVPKSDYDRREIQHAIEVCDAILNERKQHLF